MAWRWVDPAGRAGAGEATTCHARRAAVAEACKRGSLRYDPDCQALLWRSLARAGWRIAEVDR